MNTVWLIVFALAMFGGIIDIGLLVLSFLIKKLKSKRKVFAIILGVAFVMFWVSAFAYDATLTEEQRMEIEEREQEKEKTEIKEQSQEEIDSENHYQKEETEVKEKVEKEEETEVKEKVEKEEETEVKEQVEKEEETEVKEQVEKEENKKEIEDTENLLEKTEKETESEENNNVDIITYEYDELQKVFLAITVDTTPQELETLITEYNLYYTIGKYNQSGSQGKAYTYKIAYTEGAAKQKYADSGDYLEVSFDNGNEDTLKFAHYVKSDSIGYTALLYNYGTWYDFSHNNAEDYSGYYINDSFGDEQGIVVKYTNGNDAETNYFKYNSAEEVINKIIDNIDN